MGKPFFLHFLVSLVSLVSLKSWLNMDSSEFALLGYQQFQERSEQAFASDAEVIHELKEAQVKRQFFLRDAPMGSQP